ncbi:MAG: hypothetical protein M0R03_07880 [Novosphingobium sp.]|nr:hypothetical protein [Novosphingobium sp.]
MSDLLIKSPLVYEPLRQNRFLFRFPSDLGIQEWYIKSGDGPKYTQNVTEIPFLNTSTWVVGRYTWDSISVSLRQMIGPSTAQAVMEWVRLHNESVTGRAGYAAGYKRNVELEMLDPNGVVVQKWILVNCMIGTNVAFGSLSYDSNELAEITLPLQMDYCVLAY